jgi:hypothetical protein
MRNKTMFLVLILILLPASIGAQERGEAAAQAAAEARIAAALETAAEAQIPASLLERKMQEGRAKGVSEAGIAVAVEAQLGGLLRAQEALARAGADVVTEGELLLTADALQLGVSQEALMAVRSEAPQDRRLVATAVLASLVQLGLASDQALARVSTALQGGPDALMNLRTETVADLRARGQVPVIDLSVGARGGAIIRIP